MTSELSQSQANELNERIRNLMLDYYRAYYLDALGLEDWRQRVESFRYQEEVLIGKKLERVAISTGVSLDVKRILVVGCGTGAELFYLLGRSDIDVRGIEPSDAAIEICNLKAEAKGMQSGFVTKESLEQLSFADGSFDLIICFTVLEHVANVDKALQEMERVLAPGGNALVLLPDYRFPEEPHYKLLTLPPVWFSGFVRLHLLWLDRPTRLFETLNLLTRGRLTRKLRKLRIVHRVIREYSYKSKLPFVLRAYSYIFGIDRNQMIVLSKPSNR
jgi:SAM-dependent methyltransferase